MPSPDLDKISIISSSEVDKNFVGKFSGSFSVGASNTPGVKSNIATETVAHSQGVDVLPVMQFSTNGTDWYDAGTTKYDDTTTLKSDFAGICYTTSTNIVIIGANFTGSSQTCHYRGLLVSDD